MFNTTGMGYSLSDVAAVTGNNRNGAFGDDWAWIIILLLCGWGNGGFGFGGRDVGGTTTREEISYGFDMNGLENGVRGIQQGLCDGFYAMNTGILNGFNGVENAIGNATTAVTAQITGLAAENAAGYCATQNAIRQGFGDLGYALATQSCETRRTVADSARDIIDNNNAGVRAILDFLTEDKIATLTAENQNLKFAASQIAQNNYLVNALRDPNPVPAYVVPNPNCCYGVPTCGANF